MSNRLSFGLLIFGLFLCIQLSGQSYQDNQRKLDLHHGGIGLEISRPVFGGYSGADDPWYGINLVVDGFEFRWMMGRVGINPSRGIDPNSFDNIDLEKPETFGSTHIGREWSIGGLFPLSKLRLGGQATATKVARFHPVLGFNFGSYAFWEKDFDDRDRDIYAYMALRPGFRLRLPTVTVELTLNTTLGFYSGDVSDPMRMVNFMPSLIFRLDAMKQKLNPTMIYVNGTQVSVQNYSSQSSSRTYYRGTGSYRTRVTETTTVSSGTVNVQRTKVGIQDIGPFFGIGPKISVSTIRNDRFSPVGILYGAEMTSKAGWFYLGLNMESGRIGHASELRKPDSKSKAINPQKTFGRGSYRAFMSYFDLGVDISPAVLALFGLVREESSGTSYFSLLAGYSIGISNMRKQSFDDPEAANAAYDQLIDFNPEEIKEHRLDPRAAGFGRLAGWWIGMDVGVLSFRFRKLNHIKSPFANNTFISLSYKIPMNGKRR